MAKPADAKTYAKAKCILPNMWQVYEPQIQQESGWEHWDAAGNVKTSPGGAKGLGQIVPNSHPNADWANPYGNMDYSINLMIQYYKKFGSWKKALAAYNWGPANVSGYTNAEGIHPAWNGERSWRCPVGGRYCAVQQMHHYLDVILGPEWKEPTGSVVVPDNWRVGDGLRNLMKEHGDSPATHEMYYKDEFGENQYSEAFGQSGARYCYVFSLNQNFRFPAD